MNEKLCESCAGFAHNEECCTDESQATMVEGVLMGLHRKAGLYCVECRGM